MLSSSSSSSSSLLSLSDESESFSACSPIYWISLFLISVVEVCVVASPGMPWMFVVRRADTYAGFCAVSRIEFLAEPEPLEFLPMFKSVEVSTPILCFAFL